MGTVTDFMATGYYLAEPLVLITTTGRRDAICRRLSRSGISWVELEEKGEAIFRNGFDLLDRCMVDGMPDEAAFTTAVGELLTERGRRWSGRTRCFGDMVDVRAVARDESPGTASRGLSSAD